MKLTVCLLTKGESALSNALTSIAGASEVLVIAPKELAIPTKIAKSVKRIDFAPSENFAEARNLGLASATNDWILFLDSDEIVTKELFDEIADVITQNTPVNAYRIRRTDFFWNHEMRFGETLSVRANGLIRLVKKNSGTWHGRVHEVFVTQHKVKQLRGRIKHYPHQTIAEFLTSVNHYSDLRAQELRDAGVPFSVWKLCCYPLGKFIYTYFLRLGFLDGPAGFVYSFMMSFHSFLVRAKLLNI